MAFDVLSIPAMSVECERVFSGVGALVTNRKRRMLEDIIEAIECLRSWWHQKLITRMVEGDDEASDEEGGEVIE